MEFVFVVLRNDSYRCVLLCELCVGNRKRLSKLMDALFEESHLFIYNTNVLLQKLGEFAGLYLAVLVLTKGLVHHGEESFAVQLAR